MIDTLKRTKRLEGWYGIYKGEFHNHDNGKPPMADPLFSGAYAMFAFMLVITISSVIFVGGSAKRGPKGTYTVPAEGGIRMGIFFLILSLVSLPMAVIVNRSVITPYRLTNNPRESLLVLLSPHELSRPTSLYTSPGLLVAVLLRSAAVVIIAGTMRWLFMGSSKTLEDISAWKIVVWYIFQALSATWLTPLEVIQTKLSVQPNIGEVSIEDPDGGAPEGLRFAGTEEDVVGLRPTTEPYLGFVDAVRKIIDEEGWQALYRGWIWTAFGAVFAAH